MVSSSESTGKFAVRGRLYDPEIHVPLMIFCSPIVPAGKVSWAKRSACGMCRRPSSDVLGYRGDSSFPGMSLAETWPAFS